MTREELLKQLTSIEWNDIEFKEASWAVPKSALETVSAFANTNGGHLVFGVKEAKKGTFSVTGVSDVDKVQNDFLTQTRDPKKISAGLDIKCDVHVLPEGTVLCFHIPESPRASKPVYVDGNPKNTYVRRGSGDYCCTSDELKRFIRDASSDPYDSETVGLDPSTCFDEKTVRRYRAMFEVNNPGKDDAPDEITFLRNRGFLVECDGKLLPTRASVLVLGAEQYVLQQLPRMVVDLQFYRHSANEYSPATRWDDRVVVEANLIEAWTAILDFYLKHSERPFSVDPATLRRHDDPPDYISFREAAINLLIHQDFGDATRVPVIRFFKDRTEFFNPGDAFSSREQLLDPGDKPVRNPRIVGAFRRVGLSDQGGTGVPAIVDSWRRLGFVPPDIENNKADKSFRLQLLREKLITPEELLAQASLGVKLSEQEAAVFAFLIRRGEVDLADIKALTGLSGPAARELAQRLSVQVILRPAPGSESNFQLVDHLRERFLPDGTDKAVSDQQIVGPPGSKEPTAQVTVQVGEKATEQVEPLRELTEVQWVIVENADTPRSISELMAATGYKQRAHFKANHVKPLLDGGVIRMTVPDKPNSSKQKYVLTEAGLKLKSLRISK